MSTVQQQRYSTLVLLVMSWCPGKLPIITERVINPQLFTVNGVSKLTCRWYRNALRVWLDPSKMAWIDLTASDVMSVLNANNFHQSATGQAAWWGVRFSTMAVLIPRYLTLKS
ncbi:efflux RND transporter permease subunit [Vibrio chagasii]|nr:efflux RND transporter permease subunit [Vibrio chagasii]